MSALFAKLLSNAPVALAFGAAVGGGGTLAAAQVMGLGLPSSSGVIHGCVDRLGFVRIVDGAGVCFRNETSVTWNRVGPKGDTGATGDVGAAGAPGAVGPQGPAGVEGAPGAVGATGPAGAPGANGSQGSQGPAGPPGATGPAGASGVTYKQTIVVSPPNFSYLANGDALRAALASVPPIDGRTPYVIKLEPGIYDMGTQPLHLRPAVDIEGSGQASTSIRAIADGLGTVISTGASSDASELRELTIFSPANATTDGVALDAEGGRVSLSRVTLIAQNAPGRNAGVLNVSAAVDMDDVSIQGVASGSAYAIGIWEFAQGSTGGGGTSLRNGSIFVTASANHDNAVDSDESLPVTIANSQIQGHIYNFTGSPPSSPWKVLVTNSRVDSTVSTPTTVTCGALYNQNTAQFYGNTCP